MSTVTQFTPIPERSDATPGLFNVRFQQLQDNIASVNASDVSLGSAYTTGPVYQLAAGELGVTNQRYPIGHILRYGGNSGGTIDNALALISACSASKTVTIGSVPSAGTFRLTGPTTLPYGAVFRFDGAVLDAPSTATITINAELPQSHLQLWTPTTPIVFSDSNTEEVYAGWWGCSPSATTTVNRTAIQQSINCHNRATVVRLPRGQLNCGPYIDFYYEGVTLRGAAPSAAWAGYVVGGTAVYFSDGTYGFSLLGTQPSPISRTIGGVVTQCVTDGSAIEDLSVYATNAYGLQTGVVFEGPKRFRNLTLASLGSFGIQCRNYGINFEIDNVVLRDVGPSSTQTGTAIQVTGVGTTLYKISRVYITSCYRGIELKAGLNCRIIDTTVETCDKQAIWLHATNGQSLACVGLENVWCESNASSAYNLDVDNSGATAAWYVDGVHAKNCRFAPVLAGQRSVKVDSGSSHVLLEMCRLGGSSADSAIFNAPTTLLNPVGSYYVSGPSQFNVVNTAAWGSIVNSPAGWQVTGAGVQPTAITFPNNSTITITMQAGAVGELQLSDAGTSNTAVLAFGPGTNVPLILADGIGSVTTLSNPVAGKFGVWKPTTSTIAIRNAVGGSRTITLQVERTEVLSISDPS